MSTYIRKTNTGQWAAIEVDHKGRERAFAFGNKRAAIKAAGTNEER